jgi:para-nitrobenzyl esterase
MSHRESRIAYVVFALMPTVALASAAPAVIVTPDGDITGVRAPGYMIYKGVPFALPPVGNLRWRPPVPIKPWSETLRATKFKPMCMTSEAALPGGFIHGCEPSSGGR